MGPGDVRGLGGLDREGGSSGHPQGLGHPLCLPQVKVTVLSHTPCQELRSPGPLSSSAARGLHRLSRPQVLHRGTADLSALPPGHHDGRRSEWLAEALPG